mmetsp:Transcript_93598/g.222517  ORF Transcript_93598/g.222517 Transcript_93598/m.222517 type:complete len:495 (+) Transcript_93598:33-1517(+)
MGDTVSDSLFDVVFIGSGFTSHGIASVLKKLRNNESSKEDLKIAFISPEERPGGIWTDAASSVKLHQQTYFYALPGIPHDDPECHTNAMHQAFSGQVRKYAAKVADHVAGKHFKGQVVRVEMDESREKGHLHVIRVTYCTSKSGESSLRCHHVIQATGFDSYSGSPRMLGVPKEVHTSHLDRVIDGLSGKRCLLVGSGKSAIDAAKHLMQKNSVRCIYRSATAYKRFGYNSPLAKLIQWFDPGRHFSILEQMPEDWTYDYSADLDAWDWYVVGDPRSCKQVLQKTRGGIIPLSDLVLMNLLLHGFGVLADAGESSVKFSENADGTVSCSLFPGEAFDCVVSATGYTGTKQLFPHCISAITPITDLHVHNSYMLGHLIDNIMDDEVKIASWNAIASHKPEFPWYTHYQHVRQWCGRHVDDIMRKAKSQLDEDMRLASKLPATKVSKGSKMAVLLLEQLAQLVISSCRLCVRLMWLFVPPRFSRAVLYSTGIMRRT